jgi:hypothetical protein
MKNTVFARFARIFMAAALAAAVFFTLTACGEPGGTGGTGGGSGGGYDGGPDPDLNPNVVRLTASNLAGWNAALTDIANGGNGALGDPKTYTITINGDFGVPGRTTNNLGNLQYVTVKLTGTGRVYLTSQGYLLGIGAYQEVYIDGGLTLQGLKNGQNSLTQDNNGGVIYIGSNATLVLKDGTIKGNYVSAPVQVGGVHVGNGAMFTMTGGEISGNTGTQGGGVNMNGGSFEMTGGTISGNNSVNNGGGVAVLGSFTMTGGTISSNKSGYNGGGVWAGSGTFNINYPASQGSIVLNTASNGGPQVFAGVDRFKVDGATKTSY